MGDSNEPTSRRRSLSGILIAAAIFIAAIGGLIVVLHSHNSKAPAKAHGRQPMVTNQSTVNAIEDATKNADTVPHPASINKHHDSIVNKTLKGNIGKDAVVFTLTFNYSTKKIDGHYNYTTIRNNEAFRIDGKIMEQNIELHAYTHNVETAVCKLSALDNRCYEGKMYNKTGKVSEMKLCE